MPTPTYDKIATYTAPSSQSSYTFSTIPSTYTDLVIIVGGNGSGDASFQLQFNADTGSNYSVTFIYGTGSSAVSARASSANFIQGMGRISTTSGTSIINIPNYANTSINKTVIGRGNTASGLVIAAVGLWRNTNAITSVTLTPESGQTIATGAVLTLYGIKAA